MSIENTFERAEREGVDGSFIRINDLESVPLFVGIEDGKRAILLVCPSQPPEPPAMGALTIAVRKRQKNEWALVVRLQRADLKVLFSRLAQDLTDVAERSPSHPGEAVVGRLRMWQRLFSRGGSTLLDDHEIRGLAAELCFLNEELAPRIGNSPAVAAWVGPYMAPKDFALGSAEIEVKACHSPSQDIVISSLEQLTDTGLPLFLWCKVVELDRTSAKPECSLAALVGRTRKLVQDDPLAEERLEDALRAAGYEDRPEYERCPLSFGPTSCYAVRGGFPRIQRTGVSAGVVEGRYTISSISAAPFIVELWQEMTPRDGRPE